MSRRNPTATQFIEGLLGEGRYTFERKEAAHRLGGSPPAVYMALYRLQKSGWLVMPKTGFYVIVDPQHRVAGTLPPEWFVHDLMAFLKKPYYVGLLSAAQLHGAAHHAPQEFQVVVPGRGSRVIQAGNVRIRFLGKGPFRKGGIEDRKTPTGILKVSTPETAAWDLVRYPRAAGGLDHVVTVLSELAESLQAARLSETVIRHGEPIVAQRLGYLLSKLGHPGLVGGLADFVKKAPHRRLDPSAPWKKASVDRTWHLNVNAEPESEA